MRLTFLFICAFVRVGKELYLGDGRVNSHLPMSDEKGFLTTADREFLRGEREYTGENAKQMRYQRRESIRERTRGAFRDFSLLYDTLDEKERNKIFDVGEDRRDVYAVSDFQQSLFDTVAFLYISLEGEIGSNAISRRSFRTPFRTILEMGVSKAEIERHPQKVLRQMVEVDFSVDVTLPDATNLERAIDKIARLREYELSGAEARALFRAYDPGRGYYEGGLETLSKRIETRREELGIDTDPLTEEEIQRLDEKLSDDVDSPDDEQANDYDRED